MLGKFSLVIALLFFAASIATADPIVYTVTVDTSSIAGTAGSLDFQFNPGPVSQSASLQVLDFSSDGTLAGSPSLTGDVSIASLPATLTFDNGTQFNDYFEGFTYGTTLSFEVSLYGPALTSPDRVSTSAFGFSMFSDAGGTTPTLTTDTINGFAVTVNVNLDGTTTLTDNVAQSTVTPEPGSLVLLTTGFLGIAGTVRRRLMR